MRITKDMIKKAKRQLIEDQAMLCAIAAREGKDGLWKEHQKLYPHYIGGCPENVMELLRELLYNSLEKALPSHMLD